MNRERRCCAFTTEHRDRVKNANNDLRTGKMLSLVHAYVLWWVYCDRIGYRSSSMRRFWWLVLGNTGKSIWSQSNWMRIERIDGQDFKENRISQWSCSLYRPQTWRTHKNGSRDDATFVQIPFFHFSFWRFFSEALHFSSRLLSELIDFSDEFLVARQCL